MLPPDQQRVYGGYFHDAYTPKGGQSGPPPSGPPARSGAAKEGQPIDMARMRQIFIKKQRGEALTPEESDYLNRTLEEKRQQQQGGAVKDGQPVDVARVKQIIAKKQQGQPLTPEENDYFNHRTKMGRPQQQGGRPGPAAYTQRCSLLQVPLMKELLAPEVRQKGYQTVFLDVITASGPRECYHPDLVTSDHTHPSESGRQKVADLLLKFFKTDAGARGWFVKQ